MKITIRRNKDGKESFTATSLHEVFRRFTSGTTKKQVERLRQEIFNAPSRQSFPGMVALPRAIFPALFRKEGDLPVMVKYNGIVVLPFTGFIHTEEAEKARNELAKFPQTMAAFIGASGKTVKVLVRFTLPDGTLPQQEDEAALFHVHAIRWATRLYNGQFPYYSLNSEYSDYRQECCFTYDPSLYWSVSAIPIQLEQPLELPEEATYQELLRQQKDPLQRLLPGWERSNILSHLYETSLNDACREVGFEDTDEDRKQLLIVIARNCFHSGLGEEEAVRYTLMHFYKKNPTGYHPADFPERLPDREKLRRIPHYSPFPTLCSANRRVYEATLYLPLQYPERDHRIHGAGTFFL